MKPVIALVGRSNVGKSTLFNYLTRSKDALVADQPGLTRDRIYGVTRRFDSRYIVVDTGGIEPRGDPDRKDSLRLSIASQAWQAVEEADLVFFMADGIQGLVPQDREVFSELRRSGYRVFVLVNKADMEPAHLLASDFSELGAKDVFEVSSRTGKGVEKVLCAADALFPPQPGQQGKDDEGVIRVAIAGRPNVGKSTLANALLDEERFITSDVPGTTRDSIAVRVEKSGMVFELIDTAGVRRRSRVHDMIEKFSVVKTLQAIEAAHVVILMLDGTQEFAEQDARLAGTILESGRALVVAVNKTDACSREDHKSIRKGLDLKLRFLDFAERQLISAIKGEGIAKLMQAVTRAHAAASIRVSTPVLTRMLEEALDSFQPPLVRGQRIRLKYATQTGTCPPTFILYGNQIRRIPGSYKRYLENYFRRVLQLIGTPVRLEFRQSDNPYAGRRNTLTPRQQRTRRRQQKNK